MIRPRGKNPVTQKQDIKKIKGKRKKKEKKGGSNMILEAAAKNSPLWINTGEQNRRCKKRKRRSRKKRRCNSAFPAIHMSLPLFWKMPFYWSNIWTRSLFLSLCVCVSVLWTQNHLHNHMDTCLRDVNDSILGLKAHIKIMKVKVSQVW